VYQVAWLRELRLVFGASTPASAAVLGVFMGGLGLGSLVLGGRADRTAMPLQLYAKLEALIALTAAITPALLWAARSVYIAVGGAMSMGIELGTVVRLLLSALVLLPPTFLMGGTLPAAARAATMADDAGRRDTALLYGANTIGAVVGAALTTFLLMEVFGTRLTLWLGCTVNALVAMLARVLDRSLPAVAVSEKEAATEHDAPVTKPAAPPSFVLFAAALVGLVFLQLELVWYRMLSPLLGGSTYTFGLILAVALFGIGVGGLLYNRGRLAERPTLVGFGLTCALEALFVAIPLALGDRIALTALFLRPLGVLGLSGHAAAWTIVTAIVALPAALIAGYQFPLLIGLLGSGRGGLGRHVGLAYAFNTVGSIVGSIATGFIILPVLGAVTTWALSAWMLVALGAVAVDLGRGKRLLSRRAMVPTAIVLLVAALLVVSDGPTAVWRQTPIGNGRVDFVARFRTRNQLRGWMRGQRRAVVWEREGRESNVALVGHADIAFYVNGKADGSAVADATTQVMSGLLGAILNPEPKRILVIGLGTGATAGWLGKLPSVEAVDVVEIEPAIVDVARELSVINEHVLDNPKVNVSIGDAREVLLTTPHTYDIIFSEPSNPYRAGIASLFTHEFYQAVKKRLRPGGTFLQWIQGYEIDGQSVRTVYVTLSQTFPSIQSWRTDVDDLFLVARDESRPVDMDVLRKRVRSEPYQRALTHVWGNSRAEAVLGYWVASDDLPRDLAARYPGLVNTDDRNLLEFGLARTLGRPRLFSVDRLRETFVDTELGKPPVIGEVDWEAVQDARMGIGMVQNGSPLKTKITGEAALHRYRAFEAWGEDQSEIAVVQWEAQPRSPTTRLELLVMSESYAAVGDTEKALPLIARLRELQPVEAAAVEARLWAVRGDFEASARRFEEAFTRYRHHCWASFALIQRSLLAMPVLAQRHPTFRERFVTILREPFAANVQRDVRHRIRFQLALPMSEPTACVEALKWLEPHTPWERTFLEKRLACYERAGHPRAAVARTELTEFLADSGISLADDLGLGPVSMGAGP
jgi:spermidine synthase